MWRPVILARAAEQLQPVLNRYLEMQSRPLPGLRPRRGIAGMDILRNHPLTLFRTAPVNPYPHKDQALIWP